MAQRHSRQNRRYAERKASPARRAARLALTRIRQRDAFARPVLEEICRTWSLSPADEGFAQVLVYGVVSTEGVLDDLIDAHAQRPESIGPKVRDAMRIAAYELVFLGKESHAAVNEGVELVREATPGAAGFANAVLRKVAEDVREFPFGDIETDDDALAYSYGFPRWMGWRLIDDMGRDEAENLMRTSNGQAPVYLGVNRFKCANAQLAIERLEEEGVLVGPTGVPGCLLALDAAAAVKSKALQSGLVVVADFASQLVAYLAHPRTAGDFLEIGAGRGTKTVLLQGHAKTSLGKSVSMFSVDNRSFKSELLEQRMADLAVPKVTPVTADATDLSHVVELPSQFAGVFVDAPCSGLGTLRRHPEERWRVTEDDVDYLSDVQYDLLCEAARVCAPGGRLVYATCTVLRQENEYVVEDFLASEAGAGFKLVPVGSELPEELRDWETPEGFLRTRTGEGGPDAHFAAVLKRVK